MSGIQFILETSKHLGLVRLGGLAKFIKIIHHMGSRRRNFADCKVVHLLPDCSGRQAVILATIRWWQKLGREQQRVNENSTYHGIEIANRLFENVAQFKYLGIIITSKFVACYHSVFSSAL
jgi:hypothetical protein